MMCAMRRFFVFTTLMAISSAIKALRVAASRTSILRGCHIDAIKDSSLAAILTEWEEFKTYDWRDLIKKMKNPSIVYDGRNILPLQDKSINLIKLGVK